ncbi:ABC transporter ATP-binding protein [Paenibacillus illinoisensis]|uniref:ABC transporter ATP-binding protein n=1 Tax=Paenibacillus illinoisensis TaxID=59845 RepID=UPI00203AF840|nr:oligopeptide/dipeptide ABC transporter ATP-binding protein [Paenibacillus illinoisensis]MCM3203770.1 ATP-binding cassette domain-containing protein [Paenibacillus illinoisensis]
MRGMSSKRPPLLSVEGLKVYYPIRQGIFSQVTDHVKAVDGISFSIPEGETLGLVGESGCGKSSVGRTLLQLETPYDGSILYAGRELAELGKRELRRTRASMGMIFQDPYSSLNPRMRISDILAEPLLAHRIESRSSVAEGVDQLMETVGIPKEEKGRYPYEFSGGQRQRIGIARALSLNPRLIVCDEPVSALDVSIQAQILNLLKKLQKEKGLAYLFIGHGLGAVRYISDRIAVMYLGKIVEIASREKLFRVPKHPYTNALLSANPVIDPKLRSRKRIIIQGDVPNPVRPPGGCRFHTRCPIAKAICREFEPELKGHEHAVACFAFN